MVTTESESKSQILVNDISFNELFIYNVLDVHDEVGRIVVELGNFR